MHGRLKVKTTKEQQLEQRIKDKEKALHFQSLTQRLFELRPSIKVSQNIDEIFKLTVELLLINPDFYTVWNIRKEALLAHAKENLETSDSIWKEELSFTIECLKQNEKSYSVWQHRIWTLSMMPKSEYNVELLLCNSFLMKDERNFHCWDYRNYISDLAQTDIEKELEFTTQKIRSNFSNFSAWHRRHKLFLRGLELSGDKCPEACNLRSVWPQEYVMILNAIYTDPSDKSAWLYHNWLIKNNLNNLKQTHLDKLEALHEIEPDNEYVKQGLQLARDYFDRSQAS